MTETTHIPSQWPASQWPGQSDPEPPEPLTRKQQALKALGSLEEMIFLGAPELDGAWADDVETLYRVVDAMSDD